MSGTIRAEVRRGNLKPLEKLNLPEGSEVTVTILSTPPASDRSAFRRAAGSWKGTIDAKALIRGIYKNRTLSTRPTPRL